MPLHGKPEEPAKPFDAEADDEQPPDDDESGIGGDDTEVLTDPEGVAAAPPPAEPAAEKSSIRQYIVLREYDPPGARTGTGKLWEEVEVVPATGQGHAFRTLGEEKLKPGSGKDHVAVPSRSWNPEKVVVDTVTTINIG
jgi:hypothetical protein